jgi:ABC-type bacteriocin/lantibiotic exporter with double-glycine peptidase domain
MQTALAKANTVADETLAHVKTVRAHAATNAFVASYDWELLQYYYITLKAAFAYGLFVALTTLLPVRRLLPWAVVAFKLNFNCRSTPD